MKINPISYLRNPAYRSAAKGERSALRGPAMVGLLICLIHAAAVALILFSRRTFAGIDQVALWTLDATAFAMTFIVLGLLLRPAGPQIEKIGATSPLSPERLAEGLLWGRLVGVKLWLTYMIPVTGALLVLGTLKGFGRSEPAAWALLHMWGAHVLYCVTQMVWVAGIAFPIAMRSSSPMGTLIRAAIVVVVIAPPINLALNVWGTQLLMQWIEARGGNLTFISHVRMGGLGGHLVGGGVIAMALQVVKGLIGWGLLHRAFRRPDTVTQPQLTTQGANA